MRNKNHHVSKKARSAGMLAAVLMALLVPAPAVTGAAELPEAPLELLAKAGTETCAICAKQMRKQAIELLDEHLLPGLEISSRPGCLLVKTGRRNALSLECYPPGEAMGPEGKQGETPEVVFAFYTAGESLVGIAPEDCTAGEIAEVFRAYPEGTVFEGSLRLVGYAYGDGLAFNYFQSENRLQIHCIVLELRPAHLQAP
ncbi:MAG: hypothetical protein WAR22_01955 [Desulfomonilia bacterium]